jgi:hypothetical protein
MALELTAISVKRRNNFAAKNTEITLSTIGGLMKKEHCLLNEVARRLQVRPHKVVYAITSGQVEDVGLRIGGRRIFRPSDVQRLARHFRVRLKTQEKEAEWQMST